VSDSLAPPLSLSPLPLTLDRYNTFAVPALALLQRDIFHPALPPHSHPSEDSSYHPHSQRLPQHLHPTLYREGTLEGQIGGDGPEHDLDTMPDVTPSLSQCHSLISLPDDWPSLDRLSTTDINNLAGDFNS
jgi:hypothetical protein